MKYILIIWLCCGYGRAIDHVEFNTKEACESALKQMLKHEPQAFCAAKGIE